MKKTFFIVFFLAVAGILQAGNLNPDFKTATANHKTMLLFNDYEKLWEKVDSLEKKGLPKSALEIVNEIYLKAKASANSPQMIKSYIFKMKFRRNIEEKAFESFIFEIEKDIAQTNDNAYTSLMHSIAAEMYMMYYRSNYWKFRDRSETMNFVDDDIETWTLGQLVDKCVKHYMASIKAKPILQNRKIEEFEDILKKGTYDRNLRPTLYDFLLHRALNFFENTTITLDRPADQFALKEDFYFSGSADFYKEKVNSKDSLSLHYHAIKIYQKLYEWNEAEGNEDAIVFNEIERISFVYSNSIHPKKEELYFSALSRIEKQYPDNKYAAEASCLKAQYFRSEAGKYNFLQKETFKFKDSNKKALEICEQIVEKFPKALAGQKAKKLAAEIQNKSMNFKVENIVTPNDNFPIRITYKNIDKAYLQIFKIDRTKLDKIYEEYGKKQVKLIKKFGEVVYSDNYDLRATEDFNEHSTEAVLKGQGFGEYVVMLSSSPKYTWNEQTLSFSFVSVTDLTCISRRMDNYYEYYILNRTTGEKVSGASVKAYYRDYDYKKREYKEKLFGTFTSDENGYLRVDAKKKKSESLSLHISKGDDFYETGRNYYLTYYDNYEPKPRTRITLFTDRAIYRPGQTIYFKGLAVSSLNNRHELIPDRSFNVVLYDVNYQQVSKQILRTNEYGTFNGTFEIPQGLLNGQMRIYTPYGEKYIRVEEYKRPKFEVELSPFDGNYRLGDSLSVKAVAKAYSGAVVSDAKVTYRITRKPIWRGWWSYYFDESEVEIVNGIAQTNDKGEVELDFKAIPDYTIEPNDYLSFNYQIKVDVTDLNGETQSTLANITIGYKTLQAGIEFPAKVEKNEFKKAAIYTRNLNGEFVASKGNYTIYKLIANPNIERDKPWSRVDEPLLSQEKWDELYAGNVYDNENDFREWEKDREIMSGEFNTEKSKVLAFSMKEWDQGVYVVEVSSTDYFGQEVKSKSFFKVFDKTTEKLSVKTPFELTVLDSEGQPGDEVKFLVNSSYTNVSVLYEIESQNKVIHSEWLKINNERKLIKVLLNEENRGNISVNLAAVVYNRKLMENAIISVPYSNKELDIEFSTYRNKLFPGQKEEWILKIKNNKGEKEMAEMLATLYDASLDVFAVNSFYLNLYRNYYASNTWNANIYSVITARTLSEKMNKYYGYVTKYFDALNWFGFGYYSPRYYDNNISYSITSTASDNGRRKSGRRKMMVLDDAETGEAIMVEEEAEESDEPDAFANAEKSDKTIRGDDDEELSDFEKPKKEVQVRTNFNETAFFYPNLLTNEDGEIEIKFTIPESLTKWKMLGFAHTKDLKFGTVSNTLITQKDLMVMPNAPRYFRESDKMSFPVKISNVSKEDLSGVVRLEFFDALSGEKLNKIFAKAEYEKTFEVKAGLNTSLSWEIEIPENVGLIKYRVVAKTGKFSDGEEKAVPVMSNRMLVTESLPLPVRGEGTSEFEFVKLLKSKKSRSIKHHRLTLEFTANPAWYAVQALPYMMEYPYECSEQTFSRYYANSIATHIANSSEDIKAVFDEWRKGGNSKEALLSNLEKNQELKSLLLQETPWVLDAKDEGERKRRVGLLFDLNKMSSELQRALKKLKKEQKYNGGWSWFPGMPESRYITQHIVTGFGHLQALGVKNASDVEQMKVKGVGFLDKEIKREYKDLKRYYKAEELEKDHLSYMALQYLYGRSFYTNIPIPNDTKEAFDYFFAQAKKYWIDRNIYGQGMIALALKRFGEEAVPADIVKSLKENSITHQELGMYWKSNTTGYYWYQAPIETQALMVEVFAEVAKDDKSVNDLKVWLLKQKQVQDWKTTKATAEAVYALLLQGNDWLENTVLPEISLGGEVYNPNTDEAVSVEAGTGYFKKAWSGEEVKPKMGKVKVEKFDEGVSWGALYWQYFEDLDKITPHETPLKLEKKLFIERLTTSGVAIEPLKKGTKLVVGDKVIVRIELRVDRSMEFVHMKDMRASGFEPLNVFSRYKYQGGLGYYESTKDASTNFFMDYLPKGTYVFEYPLRVTHNGDFSNGITTIQCMYAPEFTSHSQGVRVKVEK